MDKIIDILDSIAYSVIEYKADSFSISDMTDIKKSTDIKVYSKEDFEEDIKEFRKKLKEDDYAYTNILDDMLENCGKFLYRATQK